MRTIPAELAARYRAAGWWTPDTLGDLLARGLAAAGDTQFRVHSPGSVLDADGYLTITDRKADFIIRGGENISALEVEEVLLGLPGVVEAAVVAAPDPRLGEHAAAVLRLLPEHPMPTMDEVREHFDKAGLARQKWPEELHRVEEFPRTPSGKVQKFLLRRDVAERARGE